MTTRRRALHPIIQTEIPSLVRLWLLRILVPLGAHGEFIREHGFFNDTLAIQLGLRDWVDPVNFEFERKLALKALRKLHQTAECELQYAAAPQLLNTNVTRLAKLVGLSNVDCRILEFAVMIHGERLLDGTADWLGNLCSTKLFQTLSILLDIPEPDIRSALSAQAILTKCGLVSVERARSAYLRDKLNLLSEHFADTILSSEGDPVNLLRETVSLSTPAHLCIADYDHITPALAVLRPYLKKSIETCRTGVNIFLHGMPGTGKSQLAKVLAQELGCELFEVASEDFEGYPVDGERRLRAFRAAQRFFSQRRALILFDEVEDVFNDGSSLSDKSSAAHNRKAWINRILEENSVPTIWLSNSIYGLDRAFIRRFDMVFELPVPPKQQRQRILQANCPDLLDAPTIARIADSESLAPAVVTRAASVVRSIRDELGGVGTASAFELLIGNTLGAQGHRSIQKHNPNQLPEVYDPLFIHSDSDLAQVSTGLMQSKSGRLCLYGPPGTGKTAYARWLADQMGIPLIMKRASDLMSKYVGENEKNIASAFKQAEQDRALLVIDEVDSFLQDRRGAQRGWEVSLVNEMLTQMESFSGIFIASTNLMEGLDQAALRRFDLKVKFSYLKPAQAWQLLNRYSTKLSINSPPLEQLARLTRMENLTLGDFATVIRQNLFRPITSTSDLLSALEAECALKEGSKSPIGFIH